MMSNAIKELRKMKRLSQRELAEMLHVHQTAVSAWETGKTNPDMQQAIEIANLFGVSLDFVMGRTDFPFDDSKPLIDAATGERIPVVKGVDDMFHTADKINDAPAPNEDIPEIEILRRNMKGMDSPQRKKVLKVLGAAFDDFDWGDDE